MTLTHLHLMLNHVPVLGTVCGLGLLLFALWKRSSELKRAALGLLVITALLAVPTYLTGEPAEEAVQALPGVSKAIIEQHEAVAQGAFIGLLLLGGVASGTLLWFRRGKPVPAWLGAGLLIGTLAVSGVMAWTAHLGGQVRHSEIRSGLDPSATDRDGDHD